MKLPKIPNFAHLSIGLIILYVLLAIFALALNVGFIALVVWVVIKILKAMAVISLII